MVYKGRIKGGVVVLDDASNLAEGTLVRVEPVGSTLADPSSGARKRRSDQDLEEPWKTLLRHAGKGKGLPADLARNHDHYLHGTPKK